MSSNWIVVVGAAEKLGAGGTQTATRTIVSATEQGTAHRFRVPRQKCANLNPFPHVKRRRTAIQLRAVCPPTQNRARESVAAPHYLPDARANMAPSKSARI